MNQTNFMIQIILPRSLSLPSDAPHNRPYNQSHKPKLKNQAHQLRYKRKGNEIKSAPRQSQKLIPHIGKHDLTQHNHNDKHPEHNQKFFHPGTRAFLLRAAAVLSRTGRLRKIRAGSIITAAGRLSPDRPGAISGALPGTDRTLLRPVPTGICILPAGR